MLSVLYCGDYAGEDEAWLTLSREVKARELPPTGAPRILGIVAPYTGREIDPQRYCSIWSGELLILLHFVSRCAAIGLSIDAAGGRLF